MRYEIIENGAVVNTIIADEEFVEKHHPGQYRALPDPRVADPDTLRREIILAQLAAIDGWTDKPRTRRELQIGNADTLAWLKAQDAKAVDLRAELKKLGG